MVTSIQLGNFFSSGGKTVLGGVGGSGLDTEGLMKSLVEVKRLPAVKMEDTVTANGKKTDALGEFKTLLSAVKDAASFLRNPPGVGNQAQNAFLYTAATVVSNTSIPADSYVRVSTSPGVAPTSYNISEITSVARATKQTTGSFAIASADTAVVTAAHTAGFFKAGTITVNGEAITLEAGDTLNEVMSKFNAVKNDTGITANIIQAGANNFKLAFTANTTGTDAGFDLNVPSAAIPADADGVFSMISRTNLLANGTFNSDINSWTNNSQGTGVISWNSSAMRLDGDGLANEAFATQAMTTVIGQQYTVRATLDDLASSAFIRIGTDGDVTNPNNFDVEDYEVLADGTVEFSFTATSTTTYLTVNSGLNANPISLDNISVVHNATEAFADTQVASNAVFVVDGVTITRQGNSVGDVFSGVTFDILQATPLNTEIQATVTADTTIVKNAVINFINAYNDLRIFAAKQNEVGSTGQYKDTAVLADSTTFRSTISSVTTTLTQIVAGITGGDPSRLADVGVTFADLPQSEDNPLVRNILDLNEGTLMAKIAGNFDAFRRVFEFDMQSTSPNLRVFSRTGNLGTNAFTLDISAATPPALPTATATYDNGSGPVTIDVDVTVIKDNTNNSVIGYTLKGKSGTVLEGLQLIYASTSAASIDVTATQGLADKIFAIADGTLSDTGSLATELDSLKTADERLQDQITKLDEQIERYRQQLLDKFAALEQAISRVNNLLASIDAQNQTRYSNN